MQFIFPSEITFRHTSNVFLNTGIVALYDYLHDAAPEFPGLEVKFSPDALTIRGEKWLEVLEELYYRMGKEVYDTANPKQIEEKLNAYYIEKEDRFERFPKMNTLGLTELLTNNAQGLTRHEENKSKIETLRQIRPELAAKFEAYFQEAGLDLASNVYLNEPYTKITRLEKALPEHFAPGQNICYLTGEGLKKLADNTSTSPFLSGLTNFNSFLSGTDKRISWKAMLLSRFAPKYCFYRYASGLDTIYCYLFESDNLESLRNFIHQNRSVFMDKVQLLEANYLTNFNLPNFSAKKGEEPRAASQKDFTEAHETRFILIYAIYRRLLFSKNIESPTELDLAALEEVFGSRNIPVSLVSFKADKFSGTLRPNYFEQFNHFKFTVRLIAHLEKQGVNFQSLLQSLLFQHRSERSSKNSYRLTRRFRNTMLDKVMKAQSVLPDFENLFFWCYLYLNSPDENDQKEARYKNFKTLSDFLTFYEPILYKKMEKEALTSLQTRAVNLGKSIGMSALNFEDGDRRSNAKQARSYMVHLHKARTAEQFREAIIRFQKKYGIIVANQLLESEDMNDDQNFVFIKQFTVMAALNILNGALQTNSSTTSTPI